MQYINFKYKPTLDGTIISIDEDEDEEEPID